MGKVLELINKSQEAASGRKTINKEEHLQMLIAVLTDEEYVAENLADIVDGEVIIEKKQLAPGFAKIITAAFRKAGMSEEEAKEAAKGFKVTKEMAQAIIDAVRETDYLVLEKCNKKIQLFRKPGLEINLVMADANETVRPNPRNKDERIVIKARKKVRAQHIVHDFQKYTIDANGKEIKKSKNK